jgi:hypothetical protein
MLVYFEAVCNILQPFGVFQCHLVYFPPFWFGMLYQSGIPAESYEGLEYFKWETYPVQLFIVGQ